ncbi:MAG: hypothetical protein J2P17_16560 [Mycobacterium sp.]|nr:hypothetical protein [Mycobacterium sp.]
MNVNATEDELRNTAEALKFAAILDDRCPQPDKARIAAWAEQIHRHRLERGDLLDGLQAFYDQPHDHAIGIGDLIHHARIIKRDRLDRAADQQRDDRRNAHDTKAANDTHTLAAVPFGPVENRTPRLHRTEQALQTCTNKTESQAAIKEFFAAKREAKKPSTHAKGLTA